MTDLVNHPQHYAEHYDNEVIELTQHLSFCLGNAVKYILRAPFKGTELLDLQKAEWYVRRMVDEFSADECRAQVITRRGNFSGILCSFRNALVTELVLACGRGDKTSLNAVLSDLRDNINRRE
jgi:hypothetical protein